MSIARVLVLNISVNDVHGSIRPKCKKQQNILNVYSSQRGEAVIKATVHVRYLMTATNWCTGFIELSVESNRYNFHSRVQHPVASIIIVTMNTVCSPLWSSGQSSWLQIRRPGFDSRHCQTGSTQPREYN
jgi:hypothetical protein